MPNRKLISLLGALVYLLRRILNDWPDGICVDILSHVAKALPDDPKARVLVMEPRKLEPAQPMSAVVDMVMLNLGGKLRNEATVTRIANAAGLKVVKIHFKDGDDGHVVELVKA